MEEIVKHINDTNASYRNINAGDAKNTDLFLDNEHYSFFEGYGEEITVRFKKENLAKAILFIASILPRKFDQSAIHKQISYSKEFVLEQLSILDGLFMENGNPTSTITQIWTARKNVVKKNGEIDPRFYFNGLLKDVEYTDLVGNIQHTKFTIRNYLAGGYSDLHIIKNDEGIFDIEISNAKTPYNDGKEDDIIEQCSIESRIDSLQQILFGAPGTGKSHAINSDASITEENSIRTTFHPDSDYSTFVGCYKPTKKEQYKGILVPLIDLISISKEQSTTEQRVKFISKYAESIKAAAKENGLSDNQIIRDTNYFGWNSDTYLMNFLNEILEERNRIDGGEITYDFTPQAFTNAYVAAWKSLDKPFYLIIEEINRGNCAQIFGDIFQLLDRDGNGYSSYKTTPDQDLANYIGRQLYDAEIGDAEVKSGRKMQLPPNLHIWATMNTSDQSLFPIDSAFKRRWDWRYIPIDYTDRGHFIACGDSRYSWSDFLQKVNERVESVTQSEDKKLGYWFMGNGAEQKKITVDRFVSKVVFYLWNDVFKDFGRRGNTIFKDSFAKFHMFFNYDGSTKEDVVLAFLDALEVKQTANESVDEEEDSQGKSGSKYAYKLAGEDVSGIGKVVRKVVDKLCQTMNFEDILKDFNEIVGKKYEGGDAIRLGTSEELGKDANGRMRWWKEPFISKDGKVFSVIALWPDTYYQRFKSFVEHYPDIFPGGLAQKNLE